MTSPPTRWNYFIKGYFRKTARQPRFLTTCLWQTNQVNPVYHGIWWIWGWGGSHVHIQELSNRSQLVLVYDRPHRPPTLRVSPGNKVLAPARRSNPVLAPKERFWRPNFLRPKKDYIDQEAGGKVQIKSYWKWFKLLFCFILMNLFFCSSKNYPFVYISVVLCELNHSEGAWHFFSSCFHKG